MHINKKLKPKIIILNATKRERQASPKNVITNIIISNIEERRYRMMSCRFKIILLVQFK